MTSVVSSQCDPHTHTTQSDGLGDPRAIVEAALSRGLTVLGITDHDSITGAIEARDIAVRERLLIDVIVGCEVTAARGMHVLALFIEEPIPMFKSIEWTVRRIVELGGVALAPHPLSRLTPSLGRRTIERLLESQAGLTGIETINPSPAGRPGAQVSILNQLWRLAEFGGSDAHFPAHVGAAFTSFPGTSAQDFRTALENRTTVACRTESTMPRIPLSDYARQSGKAMVVNPLQKFGRKLRGLKSTLGET